MTILGIDPGLHISGFSVVAKKDNCTYLSDYGYVRFNRAHSLGKRIEEFYTFFGNKICTHQVDTIALETPFLGKNAQNFLKLGYLRGIVYLLSQQHDIHLLEFAPRQVKQAVTGFGGAGKDQVARVIYQLFSQIKKVDKEDVTDAIAISLCGLWQNSSLQ